MSFYTSLSGLQASQTEMSTISHNLANVATSGFKKSRTDFADVIASNLSTDPRKMIGSGAVVKANRQQFSQGNLTSTSKALDLAVSGDGFFAVKTGSVTGALAYTRNGAFSVDTSRYIVDAQGSYLQAYPVDASGIVTATGSDGLIAVQIPEVNGVPIATSNVALGINLSDAAAVPTTAFNRTNTSTYNNSTTSTIYDAAGNAMTLTNYYVRNDDSARTDGASTWSVHSFVGDKQLEVGGATTPIQLQFNAAGALTAPGAATAFDPFTPKGSVAAQPLSINYAGSTQSASAFAVAARSQDGATVGEFTSVVVDKVGLISATFSDGTTLPLGKVAIAGFTTPEGLRQNGNSYWTSSGVSGMALLSSAGSDGLGSLMSGTIEGSNVDITEELVGLIAAQRNFQANAKALDTASQISQTIFNIRG
ncbi:MAG TPA: flagellar hook protein FlgE [Sphingomonas sp.]|jgi:flagellar hook protein FlgE|uniref:flagellar hook protein FlgE n=1 Tax=Sphingomonas sp. TaxID=28214 RepID=UPI002ED9CA1F